MLPLLLWKPRVEPPTESTQDHESRLAKILEGFANAHYPPAVIHEGRLGRPVATLFWSVRTRNLEDIALIANLRSHCSGFPSFGGQSLSNSSLSDMRRSHGRLELRCAS
jgi:hypothetical protein